MRSLVSFISFFLVWSQFGAAFVPKPLTTSQAATTLSAASTISEISIENAATPKYFDFKGHKCYSEMTQPTSSSSPSSWFSPLSQQKADIILIHGFGCSTLYWRETTKYLTNAGYRVHAVDLLGQGKSAKPGRANGIEYSTNLWADMVNTYAAENIPSNNDVVVMGNSLGSCVALTVAANNPNVKGVGMYNCGVGMNSRNLLKDPSLNFIQIAIFTALFDFLDFLIFDNVPLLTYVLDKVVTKELLRNALEGLYAFADEPRVDDALVDAFYLPAKDEGSVEALNQIYTNDAGKSPMELHDENPRLRTMPMHLVWGTEDNVTPFAGPVGQFYAALASDEAKPVTLSTLEAGHIPFDEVPECNESMVRWLDSVVCKEESSKPSLFPWM